ncbi:MAG: MmcQ/YjbR family DNA-binding protein [Myxococcota bacterium]|nr:MmcQ/YjbR family DNA-binding protein [Deltaproteobacteria bacterium]MDQ3333971.1 MmcQ/YjbR family DNA-binding protein [Myxococcota bacterium]
MAKAQAKKSTAKSDAAIKELRDYGLKFPGAHLKSPWPGHKDLAVKDKTFAYLPVEGDPFSISCKLPKSSGVALMLPFCKPTGYGLGKSGWVSASPAVDQISVDMFKQWIDESYRAQAPKTLVNELDGVAPKKPAAKKKKR